MSFEHQIWNELGQKHNYARLCYEYTIPTEAACQGLYLPPCLINSKYPSENADTPSYLVSERSHQANDNPRRHQLSRTLHRPRPPGPGEQSRVSQEVHYSGMELPVPHLMIPAFP